MQSSKVLLIFAAVIPLIVGLLLVSVLFGGGSDDDTTVDPEPEDPVNPEIPRGFFYDKDSGTIKTGHETDWHVVDWFHAEYNDDLTPYDGYWVKNSKSVQLSPGMYTVTVEGNDIELEVAGQAERSVQWEYNKDCVIYDMSIDYSVDIDDYKVLNHDNKSRNAWMDSRHFDRYFFLYLYGMVIIDDTVREVEDKLADEYVRIGGSVDDRQGYADFLASFAQLPIKYPSEVPGHDNMFDYKIWGQEEYWCVPTETLYHVSGDCEDKSILLCALYGAAGYDYAVVGVSGHVMAAVHLDDYKVPEKDLLESLSLTYTMGCAKGISSYSMEYYEIDGVKHHLTTVEPVTYLDEDFYIVETTHGQTLVGNYAGTSNFGNNTTWGWSGVYTGETVVSLPSDVY